MCARGGGGGQNDHVAISLVDHVMIPPDSLSLSINNIDIRHLIMPPGYHLPNWRPIYLASAS